ncbi:hypothetical protein PGT21_029507 [Puccinia graminis f. sp. tritici]|uniref:Uncharacterized protein n=1 Tax=Puccinia graminis f. sp. tritici TaxID=56615 RepID=A0A5B0P7U5_PUCGR|nr:hypothetical protein PGT21_029507 [Puccinia graminis f. sp. tritici]KAA1108040.1 hypothetical protein PGTUg99_025843 [Puccinia graminis f. sp. tritici]
MDMDLWWCPVCERAITEQEETVQRAGLVVKRPTLPPSQPRYTSRGGVYAPKGSLYCSDACREVEELNGRFAFEQLAAYLPDLLDRPPLSSEEPDSEGTLSGTDELTSTDRSRSVSLGRRSGSAGPIKSSRTPISLEELNGLTVNNHKLKGLTPAIVQPNTGPAAKELETGLPSRRVPILLSPNGTPLIQPTFPQRPALGAGQQQRRHHSQYSPQKRGSPPQSTAAVRPSSRGLKVGTTGVLPKPSTSVPIYPSVTVVGQSGTQPNNIKTKTILNHQLKSHNNFMEFDPLARHEHKQTSLLQHYGLFFRSHRPQWADFNDEHDSPFEAAHLPRAGRNGHHQVGECMSRQESRTEESEKSRRSSLQPPGRRGNRSSSSTTIVGGTRSSNSSTSSTKPLASSSAAKPGSSLPTASRKERKPRLMAGAENPCRSWTWDHLPADVPQYPAMDLAQIRVSKLLLLQAKPARIVDSNSLNATIEAPTTKSASNETGVLSTLSTTTTRTRVKDQEGPSGKPPSLNPRTAASHPSPLHSSARHPEEPPSRPAFLANLRIPLQPPLIQSKKKLFIFHP